MKNIKYSAFFIFFLALVIRLIPTLFFPFGSGYDLNSFRWAGEQILSGKDIYWGLGVRHHYAFLPTYGILTALILNIANMTSIPFLILTKLPIIFFDSLIAVMMYHINLNRHSRVYPVREGGNPHLLLACARMTKGCRKDNSLPINIHLSLLYVLSPVPVILCAYFGQFDAIPLFFVIYSLYLISQKKSLWGAIILGIGATFKPWAIIFAPLIFFRQKNEAPRAYARGFFKYFGERNPPKHYPTSLKLCGVSAMSHSSTGLHPWYSAKADNIGRFNVSIGLILPIILITCLYKYLIPQANFKVMLAAIAAYESVLGWWGPSIILPQMAQWLSMAKLTVYAAQISKLFTAGLIIYFSRILKDNIFSAAKWIVLTVYIFSLGFAIQYLLWILPFLLITHDKQIKNYLLLVGSYYLLFGAMRLLDYNFQPLILPNIVYLPASFLLWCFFLVWGIRIIGSNN